MISPKTIQLIYKLQSLTMQDLLCWKETVNDGVFQIAYPNFSVQIRKTDSEVYYNGDIIIQIFNENATLMEEISIKDIEIYGNFSYSEINAAEFMHAFYQKTRSQALGVEKVINDIISELDKLSPPNIDDNIPF
jgi:hypothetical protein